VSDWRSLVALPPVEHDPFDIGGTSELKARHGLAEVAKLHFNENLFGPLPGVLEAAEAELPDAWMYPEEPYEAFRREVAAAIGTDAGRIFPAHGAQTLIGLLAAALLRPGDPVVVPERTYYLYATACTARGAVVHQAPMPDLRVDADALLETARREAARIVWLCDPNNPTGSMLDPAEWLRFLEELPEACVAIVDEAYADYVPPERRSERVTSVEDGRRVILVRTFSKLYGLAGLRLGYVVADEELVAYLATLDEPYNVSCAALAAGRACLRAGDAAEARREEIAAARTVLVEGLREAGAEPLPSVANFVLAAVGADDAALEDGLAARGFAVRAGSDFGLPGYVRITVGPAPLMRRVACELAEVRAGLVS
jgi:histidinol-phosphate aminotransferase